MNNPLLVAAGVAILALPYLPQLIQRLKRSQGTTPGVEAGAGESVSNFAPASAPPENCAEFCRFMQDTLPAESAADILFYLTEGFTPHQALKQAYAGGPDKIEDKA